MCFFTLIRNFMWPHMFINRVHSYLARSSHNPFISLSTSCILALCERSQSLPDSLVGISHPAVTNFGNLKYFRNTLSFPKLRTRIMSYLPPLKIKFELYPNENCWKMENFGTMMYIHLSLDNSSITCIIN